MLSEEQTVTEQCILPCGQSLCQLPLAPREVGGIKQVSFLGN